jgi:mannosyltransferase OCH1-like enzyme
MAPCRLWSDIDNLQLVHDKFPWFLDTYLDLMDNITRADASRMLYMYEYGGALTCQAQVN